MKQSILFEKGKLYVVELPEEPKYTYNDYSENITRKYRESYAAALANKVEVKNPELLFADLPLSDTLTKDGDTFPLPDEIEVIINFNCENYEYCSCEHICMAGKSSAKLVLKRIEPEKPEETQERVI